MEIIKDFLINYWKPLLSFIFLVVAFVVALVRKKPISTIVDDVTNFSIKAINYVEKSGILGSKEKLIAALDFVNDELLKKYPTLNVIQYRPLIENVIEAILSTPQKKGGK